MPGTEVSPSPLIAIVGPTAVGKTALSLYLAERLDGEIVSADSRLFYRGMDIGTAKPTPEERARVPHHLIDIADPDETVGLAQFLNLARAAIAEIRSRGRLPFVVGGTGQYVRALLEGWSPPASRRTPLCGPGWRRRRAGRVRRLSTPVWPRWTPKPRRR